jgi:hypothetical protein
MSQNTAPVFLKTPSIQWNTTSTSAVTGTDGIDGNVKTIFTADATNGSKIEYVYISSSANTAATNLRFWVNNGATPGTASNNSEIYEVVMPAITINNATTNSPYVWNCNLILPPGYVLRAACAVAGAIFNVTAVGGHYT